MSDICCLDCKHRTVKGYDSPCHTCSVVGNGATLRFSRKQEEEKKVGNGVLNAAGVDTESFDIGVFAAILSFVGVGLTVILVDAFYPLPLGVYAAATLTGGSMLAYSLRTHVNYPAGTSSPTYAQIMSVRSKSPSVKQAKQYAKMLMRTGNDVEAELTKLYAIITDELNAGSQASIDEVNCFISAWEKVKQERL